MNSNRFNSPPPGAQLPLSPTSGPVLSMDGCRWCWSEPGMQVIGRKGKRSHVIGRPLGPEGDEEDKPWQSSMGHRPTGHNRTLPVNSFEPMGEWSCNGLVGWGEEEESKDLRGISNGCLV